MAYTRQPHLLPSKLAGAITLGDVVTEDTIEIVIVDNGEELFRTTLKNLIKSVESNGPIMMHMKDGTPFNLTVKKP